MDIVTLIDERRRERLFTRSQRSEKENINQIIYQYQLSVDNFTIMPSRRIMTSSNKVFSARE